MSFADLTSQVQDLFAEERPQGLDPWKKGEQLFSDQLVGAQPEPILDMTQEAARARKAPIRAAWERAERTSAPREQRVKRIRVKKPGVLIRCRVRGCSRLVHPFSPRKCGEHYMQSLGVA